MKLSTTYVALTGEGEAKPLPVGPDFWQTIASREELKGQNFLVTSFDMDGSFPHWEMHPNGDEVLCVTRGSITFTLGDEKTTLGPGEFLIVPKGVWHTATANEPSTLIGMTCGSGTVTRPL